MPGCFWTHPADFEVAITDDYFRQELGAINTTALADGRPWLLVKSIGHEIWIGPLFVPGNTGCYRCLTMQLVRNRPVHRFIAGKDKLPEPPLEPPAAIPVTVHLACQLAALEIIKFIAGAKETLAGKLLSMDLITGKTATHNLLKHPFCSVCGEHPVPSPRPVELVSRRATHILDCGYRANSPEETLRRYEHLVSPITGVVSTLQPIHKTDGPMHVYMAGHNQAFRMDSLDFLKASLRNSSSGKGISDAQARASALCEAIERFSSERTGAEVVETASFREMAVRYGADAVHPNKVMLFSTRQFEQREAWNSKKSKFNRVPEPLDEAQPIEWTPVWSLTHERQRYLPTQLLYYQSKAGPACDTLYSIGCSNGSASGNNLEEAVLQGFCELVERDAVALWWYNRLRKPGVALESFAEPYLIDLVLYYKTLGREAWALDLTTDLGIPAFAAISRLRHAPEERILLGLGCHLDARIALQRAFAEMNQMLAFAEASNPAGIAVEDDETVSWLRTATLATQPYLAPDEFSPPARLESYPHLRNADLLTDIQFCRRNIEDRGMEMLVLDQTRPGVEMPVVKVIVPGLRHFWARFAPGRLYDVPVQMGWQKTPLKEDDLNPIPVFL